MAKYRIWKYGGVISYKDVEADSAEEAEKTYTSPESDWTVTSRGGIVDYFVTDDLDNLNGDDLFLQRRVDKTTWTVDAIMGRPEWQKPYNKLIVKKD